MATIERTLTYLSQGLNWLSSAALAGMMFLVVLNVVMRIIYRPILGTYEIVGFLGALVISLGLAQTTIKHGHVAVDLFVALFKNRVQNAIKTFSGALGVILFAMISWQSTIYAMTLAKTGQLSQTLKIPYYPLVYGLSFACALTCLILALETVKSTRKLWGD